MKSTKFFAMVLTLAFASSAFCADYCVNNPYCALMAAIGQCRAPNNPLKNGMKVLAGNNLQIDSWSMESSSALLLEITVTKDSGSTLRQNMGKLKLETMMVGVGPSAHLQCALQVIH